MPLTNSCKCRKLPINVLQLHFMNFQWACSCCFLCVNFRASEGLNSLEVSSFVRSWAPARGWIRFLQLRSASPLFGRRPPSAPLRAAAAAGSPHGSKTMAFGAKLFPFPTKKDVRQSRKIGADKSDNVFLICLTNPLCLVFVRICQTNLWIY